MPERILRISGAKRAIRAFAVLMAHRSRRNLRKCAAATAQTRWSPRYVVGTVEVSVFAALARIVVSKSSAGVEQISELPSNVSNVAEAKSRHPDY